MALSGVVLVVFYFSIFRPPERAVARSREEASSLSRSVKNTAKRIASFPGLRRKVEEHRERLKVIKEKVGAWSTSRDVAEVLVNEARRTGADVFISRNVDGETAGESSGPGKEISFSVRMPCSYRSFAAYVEAIRDAGETIAVEEISLRRQNAPAEKEAKMLTGELTVTASLFPQ